MTFESKLMCGLILITIPSIEYGGYFLLRLLSGQHRELELTGFQRTMFRAGHAHAGVIVILSLICQILADSTALPSAVNWFARAGVPVSALLISGGFFASAIGKGAMKPNGFIKLIYTGIFVLAASLVILGIGLLR
jgi:hypothetical protein